MNAALTRYQPAEGWSFEDAAHLLARTQFGAAYEEIRQAQTAGMTAAVERLIAPQPESDDFLKIGELLRTAALASGNIADLKSWQLFRMQRSANPLREKMTLFWHNHFATSNAKVNSTRLMYDQNELFRKHAIGDFRALVHGVSQDPAMLTWLDGNANRKRAANENFARELMELFTLGVGAYSEDDVAQAARAFTGWHVRNGQFWFNSLQHDQGEKVVFGRKGRWTGEQIVDHCLDHPACPQFLATKLLRQFVVEEPVEADVAKLTARIRAHDFDLQKTMGELLQSEMFYRPEHRCNLIKSPLDFVLGSQRALEIAPKLSATQQTLSKLGQDLFAPPTVKGWEGGRRWINSAMLLYRANFAHDLIYGESVAERFDPDRLLERYDLDQPSAIIDHLMRLYRIGAATSPNVRTDAMDYLQSKEGLRADRIRGLAHLLMTTPEYQLM